MKETKIARDRADMPTGTGNVLDRRSLADSHRQLASLLLPGMRVLDVGCGTGAITADVADVVGSQGMAVGTDVNQQLLEQAAGRRDSRPNLHFARADIFEMPFGQAFDIVTAARVLQWLSNPSGALSSMGLAVRSGGTLLVLDYDHARIEWRPAPPSSMQRFYAAFLAWRADAGFDNAIAERLPAMFRDAGAVNIRVTPQPELTTHTDGDFVSRASIWADVAATRGHQLVRDAFVSEPERDAAEREYRNWLVAECESMSLHLVAVHGVIQRAG